MRPVAILLIVAVVLPTVCLLWFMNQAIKNEQLAVQQRLIDFYSGRAEEEFVAYAKEYWDSKIVDLTGASEFSPANRFKMLATDGILSDFQGLMVFDETGSLAFPVFAVEDDALDSPALQEAQRLEFIVKAPLRASEEYARLAHAEEELWAVAIAGKARCLKKAGKLSDAAAAYKTLAWPEKRLKQGNLHIAQSRIMLAKLYQSLAHPDFFNTCDTICDRRFADLDIDSASRIFLLEQIKDIVTESGIAIQLAGKLNEVDQVIKSEQLSLEAADTFDTSSLKDWPAWTFKRLQPEPRLYGFYYELEEKSVVSLVTAERANDFWQDAVKKFEDEMVFCRVLDAQGDIVAGTPRYYAGAEVTFGDQFMSLPLDPYFPGWKVDLYFYTGTFSEASKRQRIIYVWTAVLVIAVMLTVSALAARSLIRQARVNRLKNDFVATVSHELKTPLASMRVLVDTVLEGNYRDESQVREYLELVAKENKRLTGLIDNFLTFSRMERNKQAFDIVETSAGRIAEDAIDAVAMRFEQSGCKLEVTIEEKLPSVNADHDAMVTVLINLLDNAWKYSGDDKQIELSVYTKDSSVCFAVKDNGLGMTRRTTRKIFDRFYQADSSLARKSEGCGLGLSIVKFIIDAHGGTIEVDSEAGKGSLFIVKIPQA